MTVVAAAEEAIGALQAEVVRLEAELDQLEARRRDFDPAEDVAIALAVANAHGRHDARLLSALVRDALAPADDEPARLRALIALLAHVAEAADDPNQLLTTVIRAVRATRDQEAQLARL